MVDMSQTPPSVMEEKVYFLLGFIGTALYVYFVCIYITRRMARKRHRAPLGWILLSLFVSPFLAWIILLVLGDAEDAIVDEEEQSRLDWDARRRE